MNKVKSETQFAMLLTTKGQMLIFYVTPCINSGANKLMCY